MLKSIALTSFIALAAVACSSSTNGSSSTGTGTSTAALTGHVTPGTGSDVQGYGGPGAVSSTTKVSAFTIDASGTMTSVASGDVAANGTYTLNVPVHSGPTLVQALNASGEVVVSALLESPLVAGKSVTVQPMTTQSSVQAAIALSIAKAGTSFSDIDLVSLRALISPVTAQVVHDHAADVASQAASDISALGVAALSSQTSMQASLQAGGVSLTAFEAGELTAAETLTAALDASATATATTQANAAFTASLAALEGTLGLSAAAAANAATNASASADAAITASSASTDLTDSFQVTQGQIESLAATAALSDAFTKASASASTMQALQTADISLATQVDAATTAAGVTAAFATWRTAVLGTTSGTGGLLATTLGATVTSAAGFSTTMSSIVALQPTLESAITASVTSSEGTTHEINAATLATLIAKAYASYDASVQSTVSASTTPLAGVNSALVVSAFVSCTTSF